jgi:DNA-binding XRE family transcriptional regulator
MVGETGPGDRRGADAYQPVGPGCGPRATGLVRVASEVDGRQTAHARATVGSGSDGRGTADGRGRALGGRLVRLRAAAGLDADEVADAAGLDRASYRSVEAGDVGRLTYLDLLAIADALAVPPAAVLSDPD